MYMYMYMCNDTLVTHVEAYMYIHVNTCMIHFCSVLKHVLFSARGGNIESSGGAEGDGGKTAQAGRHQVRLRLLTQTQDEEEGKCTLMQ